MISIELKNAINEAIEKNDLDTLMQYYQKLSDKDKDDLRKYLSSIEVCNESKASIELLLNL